MIVLEFKLKGKAQQYRVIDEMIRTAQFVRNKTLRHWIDNQVVKLVDLYKQCAIMAKEFEWAGKLNSTARQASAERAIFAIQRFFANCQAKKPGKKGYPQFKKHTRSVEYKQSGWSLSNDKRCLTFKDGFAAGKFKLLGSRDLHFYAPDELPANQDSSSCRWLFRSVLYKCRTNRGNNSYWQSPRAGRGFKPFLHRQ
jgi:putative transposase